MRKPLWVPPAELIDKANITRFINFVNRTYGREYPVLWRPVQVVCGEDTGILGFGLGLC